MSINPVLSETIIYYIVLTLCLTFTINYFVKLLFKHIDKDPAKITEYKNIINELTNKIKEQDKNINSLNFKVKEFENKINNSSKKSFFS